MVALSLVCVAQADVSAPVLPGLEQLARGVDLVVLGEVTTVAAGWNATHTNILTRVQLAVTEVFKGRGGPELTFTQLGGRVGDEASVVGGAAEFRPGERVIVFLTRRQNALRLADPL